MRGTWGAGPGGGRVALALGLIGLVLTLAGCDVVRVFFPSSHHDTLPPELPATLSRPAMLVFSKTNGFRHHEAIEAGVPALERLAVERGLSVFATENGAVHTPELLSRFDVVVWFQVSGDVLDERQRAALLAWAEAGGGFLGVHGTGGDWSYAWKDHVERLVRAQFVGHPMGPQFQTATIRLEAPEHPVLRGLPSEWSRIDEWYSFESSPRGPGVRVLATLDETTYSPLMKIGFFERDLAMGEDHPIVWSHCIGRGRAIYSALGHGAEAYEEPGHLGLLGNAIEWLAERPATGCLIR
jgi:type 1 glutamine amidotransferase